jgi:very-short-patch-repair endonuclease
MPEAERPLRVSFPPESPLRSRLVDAARAEWTNRLIDLSRRNNLLYYKPTASTVLEIPITPTLLSFVGADEPLPMGELLGGERTKISSVRVIARKGLENLEEKGLSTLYLALGACSWTAADGGRDPIAPILLIPMSLKLKGQDLEATEVQVAGEFEVNPVLLHVLNRELNVPLTAEMLQKFLVTGQSGEEEPGAANGPSSLQLEPILTFLTELASKVPGFQAIPFAVLGNFSFQKLAMVRDLENHRAALVANDVVAAIAGDNDARSRLGSSQNSTDPMTLDAILPENEFAVVEADSSQQCAILGIAAGQHAVVHGPPGTGKSQTITNLIATLAANGKRVLFVAEKRAALEVVMNRLAAIGLDHLAIDLHGAEQTPKKVMERIARTLNMVREAPKPATASIHDQFVERRNRLNQHDARMHTPIPPTQQTIYAMQGKLLRLPENVVSSLRWRGQELMQISAKAAERVIDLLGEAAGFEALFTRNDPSPWTGVELRDGQSVEHAIDLADRLNQQSLPGLSSSLRNLCDSCGLCQPTSMPEALHLLNVLRQAELLAALYEQEIFAEAADLSARILPCSARGMRGFWMRATNREYKAAHKRVTLLRKGVKAPLSRIVAELANASQTLQQWQQLSQSAAKPRAVAGLGDCDQYHQSVQADLQNLDAVCKSNLAALPLAEIANRLSALAGDRATPYRIRRLYEIEQNLYALGVQRLVDELRLSRRPAAQWAALFQHVWLNSTLDAAAIQNPDVRGFVGTTHNSYVEDFKKLDSTRLRLATERVRRAHAERTIAAMNKFPEQEALIRGEAAKTRRHKPLRKVFMEAADVLTVVCPCWMASPLSVCQLIAATDAFDYVIFDEASQVLPEDAVPAIVRGKYVIVAGDNKQLPPTAFFAAADEEDEADGDATAYESLLDMMIPFVKGFHLNWHYRSRDESLIAFSNHHIYDNRLITFPGPGGSEAISHVHVDELPAGDGQEESVGAEVNKVVELVLKHARTTPGRTLGVITMGIKHANRIQAALDREMLQHPTLADFFDTARPERFFVKNLERVQGDERDVIILSIGYGKDRAGNLPLRFGPILSAGGRRRLNVAVTRAKEQVIVVSSFVYSDINSSQVKPDTGLEFLKNYLQYASSGGKLLSLGEMTDEPMNDFEADVYEALSAKGITLKPQVGCSKFRIDLAAVHPKEPGKFVLAIECDGASYHSSYTARDRDRLRQQQLQNLGWTFHRIWSTDWFIRKQEEVERAVEAFHRAVAASDAKPEKIVKPSQNGFGLQRETHQENRFVRASRIAPIPNRPSIGEYSSDELVGLVHWVQSDNRLRTRDEIADEMFEALPFARRGARIDAALKGAIERWERNGGSSTKA